MKIIVSSTHLRFTVAKALAEKFEKETIEVSVSRTELTIGSQKMEITADSEGENVIERRQIQALLEILAIIDEQPITVNITDDSWIELNNILV